jgi:plasminogen activator inhibitor 1 RNA-binding protein
MATINPFDLLDDDAEDPSLIAAQKPVVSPPAAAAAKKGSAQTQAKPAAPAAKLPSKPLPPSQAGQLLLFSFCLSIFFIFLLYVHF